MSLNGSVALVTGAGRGIGRAVALALAELGVKVAVVARGREELDRTVELVRARGGAAVAVVADLGDPSAAAGVVERAVGELGPVDVLVNNAATVEPLGPSAGLGPAAWDALRLNVLTPVALCNAVLPWMTAAGRGRIVNVSSGVVSRPASMIGGNVYVTTKAALEAHTLNLAAELDGTGVTVNVFRPGTVDTAMQAAIRRTGEGRLDDTTYARFVRNHEEGGLITPEQSARALVGRMGGNASGQIWDVSDAA
ncbi:MULTISPECIES: SDR family NAD(P)-dependent oxidoreductase [Streptomyces]|uniref:SDR family NAD(P)-dependent oxidoreductase n=1 Tax=Streptomyces TaxID=1883 RepID=UPI0003A8E47A|nr:MULTISPECIES: SDR family oxidoreductase [Streptomyces]MBZ6106513.1 SDR family oxidoreductase [Streptomyces olivaceus]MBZ6113256.1 SDR family oxidoreductase [Streptomyces olivaceus]MBZ6127029.1 SDR family oxidoreductase [Streptomyces olivaceus]MBZ6147912.1 SDR family oxidoreductase [Streptomyces olivaceus]MBZ6161481.1 SDR family oxidoreductase [Streptomyces olivaceus]